MQYSPLHVYIFLTFTFFISSSISQYCSPSPFNCGSIETITYPFGVKDRPANCSFPNFQLTCNDNTPEIRIQSKEFSVKSIDYKNQFLVVVDPEFNGKNCPPVSENSALTMSPFSLVAGYINLTVYYNCPEPAQNAYTDPTTPTVPLNPVPCLVNENKRAYYSLYPIASSLSDSVRDCEVSFLTLPAQAPSLLKTDLSNIGQVMGEGVKLSWTAGDDWCQNCTDSGGNCGYNTEKPNEPLCYCGNEYYPMTCPGSDKRKANVVMKVAIGVSAAFGGCLFTFLMLYLRYQKKRLASSSSKLISRMISSDPSSQSELGRSYSLLPTHVFTYEELEEATNNFDESKKLGEGGFGTVYYGVLRDGRRVAVKRLYENNYRRAEQFKNEIEILSRLRHQSLVSLYGCTSRHSRELLLVYEFIPNGTLADHLHGNSAKPSLPWPVRMSIAIETADALTYLHAVEIIHRDVKSNNILLDNNFHVKVADFGLSRLFPFDKTHVSTAPQGTPGYVDPDYHQCYQLNDKSDVYSFGVVLLELISSLPAVDITRPRQEINLASMAINKIHNNALHEMVEPSLKFDSDNTVKKMITEVAELAYRCLHPEKDMRPSMEEVLEVLRRIENNKKGEADVGFLKKISPVSPDSVTATWFSRNTTPSTSE